MDAFFDRRGHPMSLMDWGKAFSDPQYRLVKTTEVDGGAVITAWVGLDDDNDPPLIFGTIVRKPNAENRDVSEYCCETLSATESEALRVHERLLERVAQGWQHLD